MGRDRQAGRSNRAVTTSCAVDGCRALRRPPAVRLALVGMLLVSGTLMAVSPRVAHGTAIHACYNQANGALRWVASGRHCRRGEAQVSWNLAGPAGQKGSVGPPGFQGVQGVAGASGSRGETGATGRTPMPGLIGAAGGELPGATGATGSPGAPGGPGVSGATGAAGANGAAGATGTIGPTGPSEGSGTIGPTGPTGPGLAATLETEKSETGVWIVTTPHEELLVPYLAASNISFPVQLAKKLTAPPTGCAQTPGKTECHVKLISAAETKEIASGTKAMAGCKAVASPDPNLLEEPVAETSPATALEPASGNLCVYTGVEEKTSVMEREAILNVEGNVGASRTGGTVAYIDEVAGVPGVGVKAQGSWAVKAGP